MEQGTRDAKGAKGDRGDRDAWGTIEYRRRVKGVGISQAEGVGVFFFFPPLASSFFGLDNFASFSWSIESAFVASRERIARISPSLPSIGRLAMAASRATRSFCGERSRDSLANRVEAREAMNDFAIFR